MDIYARRGTKIVFNNPNAGYPYDQETARKYLKVGSKYTVEWKRVGCFHTDVFLQEVPGVPFNSVLFDEV